MANSKIMIAFKTVVILCAVVILIFVLLVAYTESYVSFAPYIDTQFAEGYNPGLLKEITPGMTEDEVTAILGEPLSTLDLRNGDDERDVCWFYTEDDGFPFLIGDFAWIQEGVCFLDGQVVNTTSNVLYD